MKLKMHLSTSAYGLSMQLDAVKRALANEDWRVLLKWIKQEIKSPGSADCWTRPTEKSQEILNSTLFVLRPMVPALQQSRTPLKATMKYLVGTYSSGERPSADPVTKSAGSFPEIAKLLRVRLKGDSTNASYVEKFAAPSEACRVASGMMRRLEDSGFKVKRTTGAVAQYSKRGTSIMFDLQGTTLKLNLEQ